MSSDFSYNQVITASDLNSIAVDLGAGDFSVFTGSTPYAVDKLNEITSALVGSGISSVLNKFELSVSTDNIVVGTGIAFFESGRKIKLTAPVTIPFQSGDLYFAENQSTGNVSLNIGELPTDNYIHLATVNDDYTFADKRTIAKAKVLLPSEGNSYYTTRTAVTYQSATNAGLLDDGSTEITLPIEGISKIFFTCGTTSQYVFDISTQKFSGIYYEGDGEYYPVSETSTAYLWRLWYNGYLKHFSLDLSTITDEIITFNVRISPHVRNDLYGTTHTVEIYAFGGI